MKEKINTLLEKSSIRGLLKMTNIVFMTVFGITCLITYFIGMYPESRFFEGIAIMSAVNAYLNWNSEMWGEIKNVAFKLRNKEE